MDLPDPAVARDDALRILRCVSDLRETLARRNIMLGSSSLDEIERIASEWHRRLTKLTGPHRVGPAQG